MWERLKRMFGTDPVDAVDVVDVNGADEEGVGEAVLAQVREAIRVRVWPGFVTRDEAIEMAEEIAEDEGLDPAAGRRLAEDTWRARVAELAAGSGSDSGGPSDSDRLASAFEVLRHDGFVAEMDFTCCQNCGHAEIGQQRSAGAYSYVFFHQQDSDGLADGAPLHLAYSFFEDHPDAPSPELRDRAQADPPDPAAKAAYYDAYDELEVRVGRRVVEVLRTNGLQVEWDGRNGSRPAVLIRDWRRALVE